MSNQFLKLRRSAVPGRVPSTSSIDFGEIALNTYDGLAFIKRSGSNGEEVITLGSREGAFTGSFSGSFIGNGGGLFNISASAIVGLNLSQIATGSVSASVGVGASSFSVVSASNSLLYVSSSGNVGIATNTPSYKLTVAGSGTVAAFAGNGTAATAIQVGGGELGTLFIENQTNGGGSGINIYTQRGNSSFNIGYRTTSGANGGPINIGNLTSYAAGNINFLQNGATKVIIDTSGNVGIGTTSPSFILDIAGNTNSLFRQHIKNSSSGSLAQTAILLRNDADMQYMFGITSTGYTTALGLQFGDAYVQHNDILGSYPSSGLVLRTSNLNAIKFQTNATERMRLFGSTGNLLLQNGGTFTDSGERLQVSGSSRFIGNMVITGSGNTSATNALTVQNSDGTSILRARNDGAILLGTALTYTNVGSRAIFTTADEMRFSRTAAATDTSGTKDFFQILTSFSPTSGTAQYNFFLINTTVNQTGGANGITRGLNINPNLASAADWRSIEWTNNASATSGSWGLYGSGSAPNYLSGSLNIGTTTLGPNILNVNGTTSLNGNTTITGSLTVSNTITAQTLVVQTITSSTDYVSGSTIFGNSLSNTHQFTGSVSITGSLNVNGGAVPLGSGAAGQVTYWTGASAVSGSNNLFWDNTNGRLGIGTVTPNAPLNVSLSSGTLARFTTGLNGNVVIEKIQTPGVIDGPILSFTRADGTFPSSPSNVSTNRGLGVIDFYGYFTGAYRAAGSIKSFVDGNALATSMPMRLEFLTSTDGTITPTVKMTLKNNGNLMLQNGGTFTDSGNRLQVYGTTFLSGSVTGSDMLIRGSGNSSGTNALTIQNSSAANIVAVKNNRTTNIISDSGQLNIASSADATWGLMEFDANSSATQTVFVQLTRGTVGFASTAINQTAVRINGGFAPTSGNATWNSLHVNPLINQTGGANGITRGLYVNPTLTAAADWRSIEWSNNSGWGLYGAGTANSYFGGSVGIGATSLANRNLWVAKALTGGTTAYGISSEGLIQSDVTVSGRYFNSNSGVATGVTVPNIYHFIATQGAINGTATSQIAFFAESTLTGGTNNFGFRGDIAAATGRWNIYMSGTADNYLAGALGIGSTNLTGFNLRVDKSLTGAATNVFSVYQNSTVQPDVTGTANGIGSFTGISGTTALGTLRHFVAAQGTFAAGGTVSTQIGFAAASTLTSATNNYGFYGGIASGTGRWNLYMEGTADNYLAGSVGIGTTTLNNSALRVNKALTGNTVQSSIVNNSTINSDVTSNAWMYVSSPSTQAATFTLSELVHFNAFNLTIGANSSISSNIGFKAESNLIGATNNFGFFGNIPGGTGRWNLYMAGTANNYLAGNLGIGVTSPTATLDIIGNFKVTPVLGTILQIGSSPNTSSFQEGGAILVDDRTVTIGSWDNNKFNVGTKYNHVNNSEALDSIEFIVGATTTTNGRAMFISSSGNVGINTTTPAYKLDVNGDVRINNTTQYIFDTLRLQISTAGVNGFYANNAINWASSTSYTLQRQGGLVGIRINSTDNVSIGATTDSGHKLQVYGNTFISGTLDILDAEINYQRNNNVTTGSARLIASIPTASLNAAFFDYVIVSGSNARAGTVMSVWASSSVEWNETYTNDIGSTTDVSLYAAITGSSIGLFATSSINNTWTIKSLIRTI